MIWMFCLTQAFVESGFRVSRGFHRGRIRVLVVLLDPGALGRNAVLHHEEHVVAGRGDVVVGRRCDSHTPATSRPHGHRGSQVQGALALRVGVRGEGRAVLEHCDSAHPRWHCERHREHQVVGQDCGQSSYGRPHRVVAAQEETNAFTISELTRVGKSLRV